jgi:hypothetical protein
MGMGHNPGTLVNTEKSGKRMFITPVHIIDPLISKLQQRSCGINNQQISTIIKTGQTFRDIFGEKVTVEMTSSHSDLFVVRRCSQVQKQRSGRSLLRRHGIETTIPDDRKMRKHDGK